MGSLGIQTITTWITLKASSKLTLKTWVPKGFLLHSFEAFSPGLDHPRHMEEPGVWNRFSRPEKWSPESTKPVCANREKTRLTAAQPSKCCVEIWTKKSELTLQDSSIYWLPALKPESNLPPLREVWGKWPRPAWPSCSSSANSWRGSTRLQSRPQYLCCRDRRARTPLRRWSRQSLSRCREQRLHRLRLPPWLWRRFHRLPVSMKWRLDRHSPRPNVKQTSSPQRLVETF